MNQLVTLPAAHIPALVAAAGPQARTRFLEFFVNTIRNENTRRAYSLGVAEFLKWCQVQGVASISEAPPHIGTYLRC